MVTLNQTSHPIDIKTRHTPHFQCIGSVSDGVWRVATAVVMSINNGRFYFLCSTNPATTTPTVCPTSEAKWFSVRVQWPLHRGVIILCDRVSSSHNSCADNRLRFWSALGKQ